MSQELIVSPAQQDRAVARLEDLARRARAFMDAAKAENSRRAYRSDWLHFEEWCRNHGLVCLPATPETVALYLTALAADHKPASLQRKLTSLTKAHQAAGFSTPASLQNAVVSETLKGIRRSLGTAQPGKEPLLTADIGCWGSMERKTGLRSRKFCRSLDLSSVQLRKRPIGSLAA